MALLPGYPLFAGVVCHILLLILSLLQVRSIIRKGIHRPEKQFTLVTSTIPVTPFSWGKYIVVSAIESPDDLPAILAHELAHRKLNHRVDLIFLELLTAIQWFNPAVWLLKREMKEIHEFQADAVTITTGIQPQQYQLLLIKKAAGASSYTFASSLTHSKIKNRITMMFKEKSNPVKQSRILLLLPVAVALIYAFSGTGKQVSSTSEDNTNSKQIVSPFQIHYTVAADNPENFLYLQFVHADQQESELRIASDATQEVIREQIARVLSSGPTLEALFIEANQQVPMGYITDIKSLVSDHIGFVALSY
ncbi:MAG: M56 family metallopeptidase [Tannerellaceae bacterium]|nr:M56 family metallopeptidase [Tannerellaceae bacterium]MCD8264937.1 M56 family metallopeptidase [Tannerellaceae bacterium]